MKHGMTVQEWGTELRRQQGAKKDYKLNTRALTATVQAIGEHATEAARQIVGVDIKGKGFHGISATGHAQFANFLGIPKLYYERMLSDPFGAKLLVENMNHWLTTQPKDRLVRILDGDVRAVLSSSYRVIDNLDLAEAILPALQTVPDMRIESTNISPDRMYLKAVFPSLKAEIRVGDVVTSGVVVSNSEIGTGTASVEALMYRLVCKNGAVRAVGHKKRHVGNRTPLEADNVEEVLSDEAKAARDKAMFLTMRDVVAAAAQEATFMEFVQKARLAADSPLANDHVPEVVERVTRRFALIEAEGKSALDELIKSGDLTQWGMANAITRMAQDVESYDRSTDLERVGGEILELDPSQWRELAMAA